MAAQNLEDKALWDDSEVIDANIELRLNNF